MKNNVYNGHINSHIGRNAVFCCCGYDVADILCVTRCMVSRYVDEYISPQLRASVLLLLELLFIREGSFSCSLLSLHEIDELIIIIIAICIVCESDQQTKPAKFNSNVDFTVCGSVIEVVNSWKTL